MPGLNTLHSSVLIRLYAHHSPLSILTVHTGYDRGHITITRQRVPVNLVTAVRGYTVTWWWSRVLVHYDLRFGHNARWWHGLYGKCLLVEQVELLHQSFSNLRATDHQLVLIVYGYLQTNRLFTCLDTGNVEVMQWCKRLELDCDVEETFTMYPVTTWPLLEVFSSRRGADQHNKTLCWPSARCTRKPLGGSGVPEINHQNESLDICTVHHRACTSSPYIDLSQGSYLVYIAAYSNKKYLKLT